jgi:hypothetical protein
VRGAGLAIKLGSALSIATIGITDKTDLGVAEMARDVAVRTTERPRLPEPAHRARQLSRRLRSEYQRTASAGLFDGIHS